MKASEAMRIQLIQQIQRMAAKLVNKMQGCDQTIQLNYFNIVSGSGVGSTCTSARGSIGETGRAHCPHNECCHTLEEQEPAELKKIKKVKIKANNVSIPAASSANG